MSNSFQLDTIEEAISAIKRGEIIIVVDDADRENEGDFIMAAEKTTPKLINFMASHGRGVICAPLTEKKCEELHLESMVNNNTDPLGTAFTVSVDLKGSGVTTGVSANDRAKTILALVNPSTSPRELSRPGHVFPLIAKNGGVLKRTGHTEAAIDFARLAGMQPGGVLVEIMNEDGSMARLPELVKVAEKFSLKIVSIEDLVAYRMQHDNLIVKKADTAIKTQYGQYRLRAFEQTTNGAVHLALSLGTWGQDESVLTCIHSTKITNDILGMLTGSTYRGLDDIFTLINAEKKGIILFIDQEQYPYNLLAQVQALNETQSKSVYQMPPVMDNLDFGIGAQILHDLKVRRLRIISNSEQRQRAGITRYGLEIEKYVSY